MFNNFITPKHAISPITIREIALQIRGGSGNLNNTYK